MYPTPTPLPVVDPLITLNPDNFRIWTMTDEAIHLWHAYPGFGLGFQWLIIILLVFIFLTLLIKLLQSLASEE